MRKVIVNSAETKSGEMRALDVDTRMRIDVIKRGSCHAARVDAPVTVDARHRFDQQIGQGTRRRKGARRTGAGQSVSLMIAIEKCDYGATGSL